LPASQFFRTVGRRGTLSPGNLVPIGGPVDFELAWQTLENFAKIFRLPDAMLSESPTGRAALLLGIIRGAAPYVEHWHNVREGVWGLPRGIQGVETPDRDSAASRNVTGK